MTDGDPIRAFVALELAEAARAAAAGVARDLHGRPGGAEVRWVRPEALHVTLRFVGEVLPGALPVLVKRVRGATSEQAPFELSLGALAAFPSARRPRLVALRLAPEEPLAALATAVEGAVVAAGFAPEARRFRAHLTLGRVRGPGLALDLADADPAPCPFEVREAVLFRSELRASGARYTPLEHMPLAQARAR